MPNAEPHPNAEWVEGRALVDNWRSALGFGGVDLKLRILTFYVGVWRCCYEVENLDVLCWDLAVLFEAVV